MDQYHMFNIIYLAIYLFSSLNFSFGLKNFADIGLHRPEAMTFLLRHVYCSFVNVIIMFVN